MPSNKETKPNQFIYPSSYITSTEKDVNTYAGIAYAVIRSDMINREFFQVVAMTVLKYGCTTCIVTKQLEIKLKGNYTRSCVLFFFHNYWK